MLRVFHFIDKVQQPGGVSHLRSTIQLSKKTHYIVEVGVRHHATNPLPGGEHFTWNNWTSNGELTDESLSSLFAQHTMTDIVHDISTVVSRYYVPRTRTIARTLSAQRGRDVDAYGSIVCYVPLPFALSRQNMPNEYQAFYELSKHFHIPDVACRVVISTKRCLAAHIQPLAYIQRFCMELLNVFRVEVWRHQHASDPDAPGRMTAHPDGDTTYVLYIRHLIPRATAHPPPSSYAASFARKPIQIYESGNAASSKAGVGVHAGVQAPLGVQAPPTPVVATHNDNAAATAATAHGDTSVLMDETRTHSESVDLPSIHAVSAHDHTHALYQSASSSALSATVPSTTGKKSTTSTRGRGRVKRVSAPRPPKAPKVKAPKRETNALKKRKQEATMMSIFEEGTADDDDEDDTTAHAQPARHAQTVPAVAPPHLPSSLPLPPPPPPPPQPPHPPSGVSAARHVTPQNLHTAPQIHVSAPPAVSTDPATPMLHPFAPLNDDMPDELSSVAMDDASGVDIERSRIHIHNTKLFVQDHVIKTLQSVMPHTSISSLQLVRASSKHDSPFDALNCSMVRFQVNASMSSTKLMAFLARPEFDTRLLNIHSPMPMFRFFGITAFFNSIVHQLTHTLQSAVDIDLFVPMLIASWMSHLGYPMKMSVSGTEVSGQNHAQRSLTRDSYNTVIRAAQTGETALFNSVPSAVAVGNRVPVGTGIVEVLRRTQHETPATQRHKQREEQESKERIAAFLRVLNV
jgi:hypothetical protein